MLPRSQRLLSQVLSSTFCSTGAKKPFNKKKKPIHKEDQSKQTHVKQQQPQNKTNWADAHLEPSMKAAQEKNRAAKQRFYQLLENDEIQKQMTLQFEHINKQLNQNILEQNMQYYIEAKFDRALSFASNSIMRVKPEAEKAKHTVNKIFQGCIEGLIARRDLQGLDTFLDKIQKRYEGKNQGCLEYQVNEMIDSLMLITQWSLPKEQLGIKYTILNKFIGVTRMNTKQSRSRLIVFVMKNVEIFLKFPQQELSETTICKFQAFFTNSLKMKVLPISFFKSPHFFKLLDLLYFNKCSGADSKLYQNFFNIFLYNKKTFDNSNLEEFYSNLSKQLIQSKFSSTDASRSPLPITQVFLANYEKSFSEKNKEVALICMAIAFSNSYLSVPAHFFQYQNEVFEDFPKQITSRLREQYLIREISQAYNNQNEPNEGMLKNLKKQISDFKKPQISLKAAIASKQFEKAMKIFNDKFFKEPCLEKQRQKLKFVLQKLLLEEFGTIRSKKYLSTIKFRVANFVNHLPQEYLTQSWKKSEDLGYLLEDYYIFNEQNAVEIGEEVENIEAAQEDEAEVSGEQEANQNSEQLQSAQGEQETRELSKQEKRHQFWSNYFRLKRAVDVSKFEALDGLNSIKQSEQESVLPGQFNLNEYLSPENFQQYKELAEYGNKKESELKIFLYRAEVALEDCEVLGVEKSSERLLKRQNQLCEQNLKILQDFGLKDYDISLYDHKEYLSRIENLRRFNGVFRNEASYHKIFVPQSQFNELFNPADDYAEEMRLERQQQRQARLKAAQAETPAVGEQGQEPAESVQAGEESVEEQVIIEEVAEVAEQAVGPRGVPTASRHISEISAKDVYYDEHSQKFKNISTEMLDVARVKNQQLFYQAEISVKLKPNKFVEELLEFGVDQKQPMAIYMGEKLAMLTGQMIPHALAIRVSDFLSHSREVEQKLVNECKKCLSIIGPIKREMIYDSNKVYQHISYKPHFQGMAALYNAGIKERLMDLMVVKHNQPWVNDEPRENLKRAARISLY